MPLTVRLPTGRLAKLTTHEAMRAMQAQIDQHQETIALLVETVAALKTQMDAQQEERAQERRAAERAIEDGGK